MEGGTIYPGVKCPPPHTQPSCMLSFLCNDQRDWEEPGHLKFLNAPQEDTANNLAYLIPINIVNICNTWGLRGRGDTLPRGRLSTPLLTMFIGTRYEKLFPASSWRAFRNFKWPGSSQSLWSLNKNESIHEGWGGGGDTLPQGACMRVEEGALNPRVDCPTTPLLTMFIGTRYEKLFPVSSWRAFRNFKWPGTSQSLWSLNKNESIHEGWGGGGGTLYPRVHAWGLRRGHLTPG